MTFNTQIWQPFLMYLQINISNIQKAIDPWKWLNQANTQCDYFKHLIYIVRRRDCLEINPLLTRAEGGAFAEGTSLACSVPRGAGTGKYRLNCGPLGSLPSLDSGGDWNEHSWLKHLVISNQYVIYRLYLWFIHHYFWILRSQFYWNI